MYKVKKNITLNWYVNCFKELSTHIIYGVINDSEHAMLKLYSGGLKYFFYGT